MPRKMMMISDLLPVFPDCRCSISNIKIGALIARRGFGRNDISHGNNCTETSRRVQDPYINEKRLSDFGHVGISMPRLVSSAACCQPHQFYAFSILQQH